MSKDDKDQTKDEEQAVTRFLLRPTAEMHERTKDLAKHSRRSINAQYLFMVQSFFNDIDEEEFYNNPDLNAEDESYTNDSIGFTKIRAIKAEMEKKIPRLRMLIQEKEKLILILENNIFALRAFIDNNYHVGINIKLDTVEKKLENLEKEKKLLAKAKEMLKYFHEIDPQFERHYTFDLGNGLPTYANRLNETFKNNRFLDKKDNFNQVTTKLLELDKIINRDMTAAPE